MLYYQAEDNVWRKGHATTADGGRTIYFSSRNDDGTVGHQLTIRNPEHYFTEHGIHVCGWIEVKGVEDPTRPGTTLCRLCSVDVVYDKRYTK